MNRSLIVLHKEWGNGTYAYLCFLLQCIKPFLLQFLKPPNPLLLISSPLLCVISLFLNLFQYPSISLAIVYLLTSKAFINLSNMECDPYLTPWIPFLMNLGVLFGPSMSFSIYYTIRFVPYILIMI